MSRSQSVIIALVMLVLTGFVAFLAWQFSDLKTDIAVFGARNLGTNVDTKKLQDEIAGLKKQIKEQKTVLQEVSDKLMTLPLALTADLRKKFVSQPEYVSSELLFLSEKADAETFKVTGDLAALSRWEERNKLFLDYVTRETLILDLDPTLGKVMVTDILPGSVFYQMGLRKKDVIETVAGAPVYDTEAARARLMDPSPVKIGLVRDGDKIVLDVTYTADNPNKVALELSREEFNALVPRLLAGLKIAPSVKGGKMVGVKIVSLNADNVFSLLNFKAEDVITKIDDKPVSPTNFLNELDGDSQSLIIHFLRDGQENNISVTFANRS